MFKVRSEASLSVRIQGERLCPQLAWNALKFLSSKFLRVSYVPYVALANLSLSPCQLCK